MTSFRDISPLLQRELGGLGRALSLRRLLLRLHPLLLVALILGCLSRLVPTLPILPWWALPLVLLAALPRRPEAFLSRVRRLDRQGGFEDLLCAAVEAPPDHPFAPALAEQAVNRVARQRGRARREAARSAGRFRPLGPLYALLAFLLLLLWLGPIALPGSGQGNRERSGPEPVGSARRESETAGGGGGQGAPRPEPRGEGPGVPPPPVEPPPREVEKIAFTMPAGREGPKHRKKVHRTEVGGAGASLPRSRGEGRPTKGEEDPRELLKRAAERALGDGRLDRGEAWLARRLAEELGR